MALSENELEEFRYDVAHTLLSNMSKGSQFQYALDRMLQLMSLYDEEKLCEIAPSTVTTQKKSKDKSRQKQGF